MKNSITLTQETIEKLTKLYNEIDEENNKSCNESDIDKVTFNQYEILDTIKDLILPKKKTIDCPTVILKLHLYTMDDEDNYIPMEGEDLEDAISSIRSKDDVSGFSITEIDVTTEKLDVTNWD